MTKDFKEIKRLKDSASVAKEELGNIASRLEELGDIRDSKSLYTIIFKLEAWQNK